MTKKKKNSIAKKLRRQNRHLHGEIERMKANRVDEKQEYKQALRAILTQRVAFVAAEKQLKARYTWPFSRRLQFLVMGR